MFKYIFKEELKYNLRQPLVYVFALLFLVLGYIHFSNTNSGWNGLIRVGSIYRNSYYLATKMLLNFCVIGIFAVFIPLSNSILKDFNYRTYSLLYSTALKKSDYVFGRFFGAFTAVLIIFIFGVLGVILGSFFTLPRFLGTYNILAYIKPMVYVLPNVFLISALFFFLGTIKRKQLITYSVVLILLLYVFLIQGFASDIIRNQTIDNSLVLKFLGFIDPFGGILFQIDTASWSIAQKNSEPIPLTLTTIVHRILWIGVGTILLLSSQKRFKMQEPNIN